MSFVTLYGPRGWTLFLDTSEVVEDDPSAGTPAMLYSPNARHSVTYWCAINGGEAAGLFRPYEDIPVPADVLRWLESDEVVAKMEEMGIG